MSKWWADRGIYYSQCYNLWLSDLCVYSAGSAPQNPKRTTETTYDCPWVLFWGWGPLAMLPKLPVAV